MDLPGEKLFLAYKKNSVNQITVPCKFHIIILNVIHNNYSITSNYDNYPNMLQFIFYFIFLLRPIKSFASTVAQYLTFLDFLHSKVWKNIHQGCFCLCTATLAQRR